MSQKQSEVNDARLRYERIEEEKAMTVVNDIFRKLNGSGSTFSKVLVTEFLHEHRTLQQAFVREIIEPILEHLASLEEGQYDLRNEASVRYAQRAVQATSEVGLPLI